MGLRLVSFLLGSELDLSASPRLPTRLLLVSLIIACHVSTKRRPPGALITPAVEEAMESATLLHVTDFNLTCDGQLHAAWYAHPQSYHAWADLLCSLREFNASSGNGRCVGGIDAGVPRFAYSDFGHRDFPTPAGMF
jgi:hypothetical protein